MIWCLLMCPANYLANPIKLSTAIDISLNIPKDNGNPNATPFVKVNATESGKESTENTDNEIHYYLISLSTICIILATFMLLLILGYLNNVPIAKQCLLLDLYKDVVVLALMNQLPLFFYLMACYLSGNQMIIQPVQAKIVIYWGWMGVYQLVITLNAISIIKIFMKKDMLLDPSMPWDCGSNDQSNSINKIRLAILPFFLLLAVMLASDVHPKLYYSAIGDYRPHSKLPVTTLIMKVIWGVLFFIFSLTTVANICHDTNEKLIKFDISSRQLPNMLLVFGLKMVFGFLLGFGMVLIEIEDRMWLVAQIFQILTGLILPLYTIGTTPSLRSYAKKTIGHITEYLTINTSMRCPSFRHTRIQPVE